MIHTVAVVDVFVVMVAVLEPGGVALPEDVLVST